MKTTPVILAAGEGTRMRSAVPKVVHPLMGKAMIQYSLDAALEVCGTKPVVVIGHEVEEIRRIVGDRADFVVQEPQLGTGHALLQTEPVLDGKTDLILVTTADMPLLTTQTLAHLVAAQESHAGPITMLTLISGEPRGFGRVIRNPEGQVREVIEEAQAAPEQLSIRELNASVYCFAADWLWEGLRRIPLSPKGEYYLTDLVEIAASDGLSVQAVILDDPTEAIGINTRVHLSEAEALLRARINRGWMLTGVTIIDPGRTYIETGVTIGQDTEIWPDTYLQGDTTVGCGCKVGPNTTVRDTSIGDRCVVLTSVLEDAEVEDDVRIGPYSHLRKGAHLAEGVHIGNFGEVKNSYLGPGTKMGHFSYVGDATIGPGVNIGAGTITCNFDGECKSHTEIGANVFLGSDTMLVAPVKLGDGARTGAGSVVTKDVPPNTLVAGIPARAIRKLDKK